MSPSEATLHLPNSKTDTTGRGVDVPLVCNGTATSSLHAMRQYLGVDESYVGPLDNGIAHYAVPDQRERPAVPQYFPDPTAPVHASAGGVCIAVGQV